MHILSYTICLIWLGPYIVRILYTYMHIYSAVFARVYVCCTFFVRFFCTKVASRIDFHIISHTCIYVLILQQIRSNTCNVCAIYVQKIKERVQFKHIFQDHICMYMHIYVCIYKKIVYIQTSTNQDRICMYMHVCVCICTYFNVYCLLYFTPRAQLRQDSIWTYMYVCLYMLVYVCFCMYMHVYALVSTYFLEWLPAMRGPMPHSLSGRQPAGPTQGFLGH